MASDFTELATDEGWREALRAAPRELFVPDVAWTTNDGLIDRRADPDTWAAAVARNDAIVTQIDDGATALTDDSPWHARTWSSSASAPGMVLEFLRLLDPYPGDRVLEIGTGTGWTAALLCARLGSEQVTSIEVDEQVAAHAKDRLDRAGFTPRLIVGDGSQGAPDTAPYDRIHATAAVRTLPRAWITQTRPGGIITSPWTPHRSGGYKLRLLATGTAAVGRIHGEAAYMPLRTHRPDYPAPGDREHRAPRVDPRRIARAGAGFAVAATGLMPGVIMQDIRSGADRISAYDPATGSYALGIADRDVQHSGPRDVWAELEAAYLAWVGLGEPDLDRLGITVDPRGQHIWIDSPASPLPEI